MVKKKLNLSTLRKIIKEEIMKLNEAPVGPAELSISYGGHGGAGMSLSIGGEQVADLELPMEGHAYNDWHEAVAAIDAFVHALTPVLDHVTVTDDFEEVDQGVAEEVWSKLQDMAHEIIGLCDPSNEIGLDLYDPRVVASLDKIWGGF